MTPARENPAGADIVTRRIECGAVSLSLADTGVGEAVVFLHGAGLTHRLWDPQIAVLARNYRCLVPDLRGHGATRVDDPPDTYAVADHARDVVSLLDTLRIDRAHVVGLSLGGMTAYELAISHPERVSSVTAIGAPAAVDAGLASRLVLSGATRYMNLRMGRSGMDWIARSGARRMTKIEAVRTYMIEDCRTNDPDEFRRVWRGVVQWDGRAGLPRVRAPVLLAVGETDHNVRQVRLASRLIPDARLEVVAGAGHITNRDAPEAVNALLQSWLASL